MPPGFQGVVKGWQHFLLQTRLEIDHHVSATDEIHAREGRIADDILPGEHDQLSQRFDYPVTTVLLDKEATQPLRRYILHERLRIEPVPGFDEVCLVQIGGEHLELARARKFI